MIAVRSDEDEDERAEQLGEIPLRTASLAVSLRSWIRSEAKRQSRTGWNAVGSVYPSASSVEIGQPDLDEQLHCVLEPGLAGDLERLLVCLADLLGRDALLQPVVAGDEQLLDPLAGVVCGHVG